MIDKIQFPKGKKIKLGQINLITGDSKNCTLFINKLLSIIIRDNINLSDAVVIDINKDLNRFIIEKDTTQVILDNIYIEDSIDKEGIKIIQDFIQSVIGAGIQIFINVPKDRVYVNFMNAIISMIFIESTYIDLKLLKIIQI